MLAQRAPGAQQIRVVRHGAIDVEPTGEPVFHIGDWRGPIGIGERGDFGGVGRFHGITLLWNGAKKKGGAGLSAPPWKAVGQRE